MLLMCVQESVNKKHSFKKLSFLEKKALYFKDISFYINMLLLFSCQAVSHSFATPQTVAHQAPLSMGFSRQEYCSGLPFLSSGDLPNPGVISTSPALAGGFFTTELPGTPQICIKNMLIASSY